MGDSELIRIEEKLRREQAMLKLKQGDWIAECRESERLRKELAAAEEKLRGSAQFVQVDIPPYELTTYCSGCVELQGKVNELETKLKSAEFWNNWVYPEGATASQVQDELSDYHGLMKRAAYVYEHVTGGRISKTNTAAEAVIRCADDVQERAIEEAVAEYESNLRGQGGRLCPGTRWKNGPIPHDGMYWRCWMHDGKIKDIRINQYKKGDLMVFPDAYWAGPLIPPWEPR